MLRDKSVILLPTILHVLMVSQIWKKSGKKPRNLAYCLAVDIGNVPSLENFETLDEYAACYGMVS